MNAMNMSALPGLARVRARFLDMMPARLQEIESACFETKDPYAARQGLNKAQTILHQIAGSAGTLGFARFGDEARRVEELIVDYFKDGEPSADLILIDLRRFTDQADQMLGKV